MTDACLPEKLTTNNGQPYNTSNYCNIVAILVENYQIHNELMALLKGPP
jgi:hypothetical protein